MARKSAVGIKFKIVEKDRGMNALFKVIAKKLGVDDPHIRIGVFAEEKGAGATRDDGITNVELAAIHEYGAPEANIPERSFIRSTAVEKRGVYVDMLKKLLPRVLDGSMELDRALNIVGAQMHADVQATVRQGTNLAPLSPITIARKGSSRPLIDTGLLLASLAWQVVYGERKVTSG